jgi:hypothetical protein
MTHRTHVRISDMSLGRYTALRNHKRRRVSKKWDRVMVVRPANRYVHTGLVLLQVREMFSVLHFHGEPMCLFTRLAIALRKLGHHQVRVRPAVMLG